MRKVLLLLMLLPMIADAALFDFEVDGIYYKISNGSDVSVASTYYGNDYSGNVTIPSSVTYNGTTYSVKSIGSSAFYYCTGLTSISIPNSITSISGNAFEGCSSLDTVYISDIAAWCNIFFNNKNSLYYANPLYFAKHLILNGVEMTDLTIPDSVTAISDFAFYHFRGLRSITIGNAVTTIGSYVFYGCSGLTSVTIPNSVTSIGSYAFSGCNGLTSITIPNSVTSISDHMFWYCSDLNSVNIGNSVTTIGDYAFEACNSLASINIPNSVTSIGASAFQYCRALISLSIGNSVTTIGDYAFQACNSLTSINIPNSVTSIGAGAFDECHSLTSIRVAMDNPFFDSRENCNAIIETASNTLIKGCKYSVIPKTVTSIGPGAFDSCNGLTSIDIPNSVISIGNSAFSYCSDLTSIGIPNSVTSIGVGAFDHCYGLTSITLPNTITTIGDYTFQACSSLTSVTIPNSVTTIGNYAFYYCNGNGMKSIELPNSVTTIGERSFLHCSMQSLIISGEGEWQEVNSYLDNFPNLYIDSRITAIKGLNARHSDVYCFAATPPQCDGNTFLGYSGTLHVPAASLARYFTADYWCNFANIVGDAVEPQVTINEDSINADLGAQFNLIATTGTPYNIIWRSTNPTVASVNSNGTVNAIGAGECYIIVDCLFKHDSCYVVVNDTTVTITLDQQEVMLLPNHMLILTPIPNPIVPDLSVSSSNPSVAAARVVNNKIQVVGIKEGTTTITVGSVDGTAIPATCLVTVYTELGDVNCDGYVNISDVTTLIDYLLNGNPEGLSVDNADTDSNGRVNISDVTTLIDYLLSGRWPYNYYDDFWVDLGLPSGTLWATMNVGANAPEEYGDYFTWGETRPKEVYNYWNTYKWCNGSGYTLTKYCTNSNFGNVDNKTELEPEDDAAYVNWGPSWRMPTKEQLNELKTECTWTWTIRNGVNGNLVTGPNGASLFLPATGLVWENSLSFVGTSGYCWSRTLDSDWPVCACAATFDLDGVYWAGNCYRYCGVPVRAVRALLN